MSTRLVESMYMQSVGREFEFRTPVVVLEALIKPNRTSLGSPGQLMAQAIFMKHNDHLVEFLKPCAETIAANAAKYDTELAMYRDQGRKKRILRCLHEAFRAQDNELIEIPYRAVPLDPELLAMPAVTNLRVVSDMPDVAQEIPDQEEVAAFGVRQLQLVS